MQGVTQFQGLRSFLLLKITSSFLCLVLKQYDSVTAYIGDNSSFVVVNTMTCHIITVILYTKRINAYEMFIRNCH